jgi:hypothetical protein
MSIEEIRNRNKGGVMDRLIKAMSRSSIGKKKQYKKQEETYYPDRDKAGNGSCIIRFLPGLESEDYPYYVEKFQHGFQENGQWYIENCPSTIDKECPACNYSFDIIRNYGTWNDCPKSVQDDLRKWGRNAGYSAGMYCNILVIKDPANPENEGKVHLFKFGKGIMNFIMDKAQPQDDGLGSTPDPIDVFNLDSGANFKFIIRKKDNRASYDKSSFEEVSKCPPFDEDSQFDLLHLIDEKEFKSFDELSKRFDKVMGTNVSSATKPAPEKKEDDVPLNGVENEPVVDTSDNDDNMAYFQSIAEEVNI